MDLQDYKKVENMSYLEYCYYLQDKYGIGKHDYMTRGFSKNKKATRTNEGLYAHHKNEHIMIKLSDTTWARLFPFEWQQKENIVYCNLLEHLFLHVLIVETTFEEAYKKPYMMRGDEKIFIDVGWDGCVYFLIPELNDIYNGVQAKEPWRILCHSKVTDHKDTYEAIIARFKKTCKRHHAWEDSLLEQSGKVNFELNKKMGSL